MSKLRVAVLMGGTSAEREISLATGRQILTALDPDKYIPLALDTATLFGGSPPSLPPDVPCLELPDESSKNGPLHNLALTEMTAPESGMRPDVVFLALHGKGGEDGTIQGMLELLGIPYTGSGVLASALAMNKVMAKKLLRAEGIPVPDEIVVSREALPALDALQVQLESRFGYPAIVKPNEGGSTIGCTVVRGPEALKEALDRAFAYDAVALIEAFIDGVEITAGLLGNAEPEALPLIEIVAKSGFYDYEAKYASGGSAHIIPARLSETAAKRARDYAVRSHQALGCRSMSRVDMMVVGDQPYVLEVNTIPGMTATSLLPEAARAVGIAFPSLLDRLIEYALK